MEGKGHTTATSFFISLLLLPSLIFFLTSVDLIFISLVLAQTGIYFDIGNILIASYGVRLQSSWLTRI